MLRTGHLDTCVRTLNETSEQPPPLHLTERRDGFVLPGAPRLPPGLHTLEGTRPHLVQSQPPPKHPTLMRPRDRPLRSVNLCRRSCLSPPAATLLFSIHTVPEGVQNSMATSATSQQLASRPCLAPEGRGSSQSADRTHLQDGGRAVTFTAKSKLLRTSFLPLGATGSGARLRLREALSPTDRKGCWDTDPTEQPGQGGSFRGQRSPAKS